MIDSSVLVPLALGFGVLALALWVRRGELAPVFIAAPLAAFAGEHFTNAKGISTLVPAFLPARLFIAYFVGVAELAAALSLATRRWTRWSTPLLAVMFALFVLLMDLPAAIAAPGERMRWILAVREGSFAMGALALFAVEKKSPLLARIARWWLALALVDYGVDHLLHPQFSPGVPSGRISALPPIASLVTGALLIAFGAGMLFRRSIAATLAGALMLLLTLALYAPGLFLASDAAQLLVAINFTFDTLLFSGTLLAGAAASRTG